MTKVIGLTGGIGSGKTMVANYIKTMGFPVYIADEEAKKIMASKEVVQQISTIFGTYFIENNLINRDKLSQLVFNNSAELQKLNAIIHPLVKLDFDKWLKNYEKFPFVFKEAAILFESGSYKDCDAVISIITPMDIRIERVIKRDHTTKEKVVQRINNQLSDEDRIAKSDYIIRNSSLEEAKKQTDQILNLLENN